MEGLASDLGIGRNSSIYTSALDLYHKLRLCLGSSQKFPQNALQAAALHLAATLLHPHQLDLELTARKSSTPPRMLTAALEMIMATLGTDLGLLNTERLCARLGWSAAMRWVVLVEELYGSIHLSTGKTVPGNPVLTTSIVYLALLSAGIRIALSAICTVAHTNTQHVQRCVLELKAAMGTGLDTLVEREEKLIKEIKTEGRQEVKRKRLQRPPSNGKLPSIIVENAISPASIKPLKPRTLLEIHSQHDLGYAIM